jgi:hypothetical protein
VLWPVLSWDVLAAGVANVRRAYAELLPAASVFPRDSRTGGAFGLGGRGRETESASPGGRCGTLGSVGSVRPSGGLF